MLARGTPYVWVPGQGSVCQKTVKYWLPPVLIILWAPGRGSPLKNVRKRFRPRPVLKTPVGEGGTPKKFKSGETPGGPTPLFKAPNSLKSPLWENLLFGETQPFLGKF